MIAVKRSVYIEWPHSEGQASVGGVCYASLERESFFQCVYLSGDAFMRRSDDNGQTWERCDEWAVLSEELGGNRVRSRTLPDFYLDPATGWLLAVWMEEEEVGGMLGWDLGSTARFTRRWYCQCSTDEGRTWTQPEQLVVSGDDFDAVHWAPEIWHGENSAVLQIDTALTRSDGTVVLPFYALRIPDEGEQRYKGRFLHLVTHTEENGAQEWQSGCFLGHWRGDGSGIDWDVGDYVRIPQSHSIDGADEPGVCELPDGRLFMIIRTRTFPDSDVRMPGAKHYAVSEDGGQTWPEVDVLRYDDRGAVYSPASFPRSFVSTKNGRLYIITNIADLPCYGCDPRTSLQIAEVDIDTLRVIRDSVTVIEQREEGQQESIRFSNFAWHEDRHTKNMILFMTPSPGPTGTWSAGDIQDTPRTPGINVPPHAYRYEIELPKGMP